MSWQQVSPRSSLQNESHSSSSLPVRTVAHRSPSTGTPSGRKRSSLAPWPFLRRALFPLLRDLPSWPNPLPAPPSSGHIGLYFHINLGNKCTVGNTTQKKNTRQTQMKGQPTNSRPSFKLPRGSIPGESEKLPSPQEPMEMWWLVVTWSPSWDPGQKDFRQKLNVETNAETSVNDNVPM